MNAQKYTQKSLEAIQLAQNIALERGNVQIEEAHLLSALLSSHGYRSDPDAAQTTQAVTYQWYNGMK